MRRARTAPDRDPDGGFSLLEVVVAMFLFALLAIAVLPAALQATTLSAQNRDAVGANAAASGVLAELRAAFPDERANSCTALHSAAAAAVTDDPALTAETSVAPCPGTYPAALTVTVSVRHAAATATADASPLVRMSSMIVVTSP